jgi:nicotinamidase-related amidase
MNFDPQTTALLVIDALIAAGEDSVYEPQPDKERFDQACLRLVDAARKAGLPVIFANDDHIPGVDRELELWGPHGIHGEVTNLPELAAGTGERDFIIPKRRYSAFFGTDLDLLLRELGVRTLIACGEDTNVCVLHTLADAYYLGYQTVVAEDATRTFLVGTQEGAIEHFVKCYGSAIATSDEVATALEA